MSADGTLVSPAAPVSGRSPNVSGLQRFARRRSTIAFLMTLPLLLIIGGLVVYPFFYALYLSTLNRTMVRIVGLENFAFLLEATPSSW